MSLSVRRLSEVFEMARETVSKRLSEHGIEPCGRRHGHPVFKLKDAAAALLGTLVTDDEGNQDPRKLRPDLRNSWFQSELRRLDVEMQCGQLIPAAEHESDLSEMVKSIVQFCDTLPDQLERDCALSPEQVESMHEAIDRQRQAFYEKIVQDEGLRESA